MERQEPDQSSSSSSQRSRQSKRSRSSKKRSSNQTPNAELSEQNTVTSEPAPQLGQPDRDNTATSNIQEGSRVKKGRRSRKSSSAVIDAQQAQVAGTDKAADLERPESEHSTISAVQERSDVKKGRRSKRRRSSAASLEAPKPEMIQQPSAASLQSGASTSIPGPPKPTLVKDKTEVDKMATKPPKPTGPAQPPQPNAGMVAVQEKEAVHGEAAVPARPNEAERAGLSPQQHEGQARTRPSIRSTGVRSTGDPKTSNLTDNRRRLFIAAVMSVFALNALAMLWLLMRSWDNGEVQVDVPGLGIFRGLRSSIESRPVYMFRAIPFARSPVGPLRFADASAVPVDSRAEIDARIPKPGCAQKAYSANAQVIRTYAGTTEDCLHLNVWTPCTEYTTPGCRKTVLVFFHAIEFQNGDNNYYDGRWLAALGDLVVVAPNFRLGAFGFLNIGCLVGGGIPCTPSDVALGDQRVAVQWVLDHIATFGGNASDVVLMGSGSGAWSVGAHVLEDETAGPRFWSHERFAKVILMSESPFRRYFDDKSHELPALLNCSLGGIVEVLHCVRVAPSREIVRLTSEMVRFFGPSRSAHPGVKDASRVAGRRFLLGVVSSEGTLLLDYLKRSSPPDANVDNVVPAFLDAIYHIKNAGEVIGNFRKATTPSDNVIGIGTPWPLDLLGDLFYTCPLLELGRELSARQRNQVFGYVFDHKASFALFNDTEGAARFSDLDFVFGHPLEGSRPATAQEQDLSRRMIGIWSTFAKTGNLPSVHGKPWTSYTDDGNDIQVRIGLTTLEEVRDYRKKSCAVLPSFVADHTAVPTGGAAVGLTNGRNVTSREGGTVRPILRTTELLPPSRRGF